MKKGNLVYIICGAVSIIALIVIFAPRPGTRNNPPPTEPPRVESTLDAPTFAEVPPERVRKSLPLPMILEGIRLMEAQGELAITPDQAARILPLFKEMGAINELANSAYGVFMARLTTAQQEYLKGRGNPVVDTGESLELLVSVLDALSEATGVEKQPPDAYSMLSPRDVPYPVQLMLLQIVSLQADRTLGLDRSQAQDVRKIIIDIMAEVKSAINRRASQEQKMTAVLTSAQVDFIIGQRAQIGRNIDFDTMNNSIKFLETRAAARKRAQ